jgi:hypothetical protein
VQVLVNGVNANTAQLAQGHVEGAVGWLNQKPGTTAPVELRTAFLYNPGLDNTWFTVTGVLGALIVLNGSLVAATAMIKEKERGTVEQLLMTPASALEVVTAKIAPLFVLADGDDGASADRCPSGLPRTVPGESRAPDHGLRLLRADGHRHRHVRGDDGAVGDPGTAHAVLRQPAAHGAL